LAYRGIGKGRISESSGGHTTRIKDLDHPQQSDWRGVPEVLKIARGGGNVKRKRSCRSKAGEDHGSTRPHLGGGGGGEAKIDTRGKKATKKQKAPRQGTSSHKKKLKQGQSKPWIGMHSRRVDREHKGLKIEVYGGDPRSVSENEKNQEAARGGPRKKTEQAHPGKKKEGRKERGRLAGDGLGIKKAEFLARECRANAVKIGVDMGP